MIKLITAIGNEYLNSELKKINDFQIEIADIQYKEGIIEVLENNAKIDFIIINDLLPGEINTIKLVKNILEINSKIKIILFLEEKDELLEKNCMILVYIKFYLIIKLELKI